MNTPEKTFVSVEYGHVTYTCIRSTIIKLLIVLIFIKQIYEYINKLTSN